MKNPSLADIFALSAEVLEKAKQQNLKIATAESCTGGLVGAAITSIAGSSECFRGSIVAYDNLVKINVLNIPHGMVQKYGAVSKFVAGSMAKNVLDVVKADLSVSITGIAGPDGGSKEKPVGTVWIGIAYRDENAPNGIMVNSRQMYFKGMNRNKVRDAACFEALYSLKKVLDTSAIPESEPKSQSK